MRPRPLKEVVLLLIPKRRGTPHQATRGSTRVGEEAGGVRREQGTEPWLRFSWKGMGELQ